VLDYDLQRQVGPLMADLRPLPSIYSSDFIAANQSDRANNILAGNSSFHPIYCSSLLIYLLSIFNIYCAFVCTALIDDFFNNLDVFVTELIDV
jgi:hypothetical protein